ncbi:MAG: Clp protease ClpP [Bacteroidia bacterium]
MQKESFKYIKNISEEEGTILLYGEIGREINGSDFANEMQHLQNICKVVNVRINSIGGSVLDGYSIVSSMLNSKVPVNTYVDGLAASIAGVIAIAGSKCYMMDYALFMMHNPSGGEDKVLDLIRTTLMTLFVNRTKKTESEISTMLDKETWLNANECITMGISDSIINSKRKPSIKYGSNLKDIALIFNKIINMENTVDNTELNALKNELAELKAANEKLASDLVNVEAREKELKDKAEVEAKNRATVLVNKAEADGIIKAEEKDGIIAQAIVNYEFVNSMLSKISPTKEAVKIFDFTNVANKKGGKEDRSEWTIRDWEKQDSKGLAEIKNNTPDIYQEMFNSFYKTK